MVMDIKITCRRCGRQSEASKFVIDSVYKMAVCPQCVQERKSSVFKKPENAKPAPAATPEPAKPAGWDEEDRELEMMAKHKPEASKVVRIDEDRVKYTCSKCQYKFTYNTTSRTPANCPYCGRAVDRMSL